MSGRGVVAAGAGRAAGAAGGLVAVAAAARVACVRPAAGGCLAGRAGLARCGLLVGTSVWGPMRKHAYRRGPRCNQGGRAAAAVTAAAALSAVNPQISPAAATATAARVLREAPLRCCGGRRQHAGGAGGARHTRMGVGALARRSESSKIARRAGLILNWRRATSRHPAKPSLRVCLRVCLQSAYIRGARQEQTAEPSLGPREQGHYTGERSSLGERARREELQEGHGAAAGARKGVHRRHLALGQRWLCSAWVGLWARLAGRREMVRYMFPLPRRDAATAAPRTLLRSV